MATSFAFAFTGTLQETLASVEGASSPIITHSDYNSNGTISSGTTVPATKSAAWTPQLSGGSLLLDLNALPDREGGTGVDFDGLKVQAILFNNGLTTNGVVAPLSNSAVEIAPDATNGYFIFGTTDDKVTVNAGCSILMFFADTLPDVAAGSADEILLTGSGSNAFEMILVAG